MRKYLLALFFCLVAGPAWSQCNGVFHANRACATAGAGIATEITLQNLYNNGGPTAYSQLQIGGQSFDADPSLTVNSSVLFSLNGTAHASALVMGIQLSSPSAPWIQGRNWFSAGANPILIQPGGGTIGINNTNPPGGNNYGVWLNPNWASSTYFGTGFSSVVSAGFNGFSQSGTTANVFQAIGRDSDNGGSQENFSSFCFSDAGGAANNGCWAAYFEAHRMVDLSYVYGLGEFASVNRESHIEDVTPLNSTPAPPSGHGTIIGAQLDCGNGVASTVYTLFSCSAAIVLTNNLGAGQTTTTGFAHGIVFRSIALDSTLYSPPDAIALPANTSQYAISFWSSGSNRAWLIYSDASTGNNSLQLHSAEAQLTSTFHIAPPSSSLSLGTNIVQSAHGTPGASNYSGGAGSGYALNNLTISSDDMVVGSPISLAFGWAINHTFGGSNMKGDRSALEVAANLTATSGNITTGLNEYVGGTFYATTTVNDNGTNTGAGALGSVFAMNPFACLCSSSATNYSGLNGAEVDISNRGGTVKYKFGWRIVLDAADNGQGVTEDGAFVVGGGGGHNTGWKAAFLLDDLGANNSPVGSAGCILCTVFGSGPYTITTGIDLTGFTMTGNAFKSTSFTVDGSGNLTANAFTQGANAGIDCLTGVTAGTVVVHKGIVTHC